MKRLCLRLSILSLCTCLLAPTGFAEGPVFERPLPRPGRNHVLGEILVRFKPGTAEDTIANLNSTHGTAALYTSQLAGFTRLRIPSDKTVAEMVEIYSEDINVEYAEANCLAYAMMVPNDELYHLQWHLCNPTFGGIQMESAWDETTGEGVVVAILDTGIAFEIPSEGPTDPNSTDPNSCNEQAPDLAQTCFMTGYDFVNNDDHPYDDSSPGHGTHVAGTVAQSTNNTIGTAGVAPQVCLMPVKVLDNTGAGTYADVADGIVWATQRGAHVINLGLGGSEPSLTLENAVAYAWTNGAVVVAAAGNDRTDTVSYPAAYNNYVIAVGATRYDETPAYYSNGGPNLDLMAPGGDLSVDQNGDGYGDGILQQTCELNGSGAISWGYCFMEGTSMAAAHVSAAAALVIAKGSVTTVAEVREALQSTAEDKGEPGNDPLYGWGIIDAHAALQWMPGPSPLIEAKFTAEPTTNDIPLGVQFIDQSTGDITSWLWDFGDGETSTLQNPIHAYGDARLYTVSLTVTGPAGSDTETKENFINTTIPSSITCDFAGQPTSGDAPLLVQFTDKSTALAYRTFRGNGGVVIGVIEADISEHVAVWSWNFGDGGTSQLRNPSHTYAQPGEYMVRLTLTGPGIPVTEVKSDYILVLPPPPVAHFTVDPNAGDAPLTVQFTDKSSGSVTAWSWDFGDGGTSNLQSPSHTYEDPGDYTVTLTATGPRGLDTRTETDCIHVIPPVIAHVTIDKSRQYLGLLWARVTASVTIRNKVPDGLPIENAIVEGYWSGYYTGAVTGTTNNEGTVTFKTNWMPKSRTATFTIDKVTKDERELTPVGETSE
ncbi:MAG: S8 family serine peptidase [Phycisphaerales bacterium]|nr:MAG: S8 family serine peptidase [Phycisphaerales bacterium]